MPFIDPERDCTLSVSLDEESVAAVKGILDSIPPLDRTTFSASGCRVIKHPGACALCVVNNDCSRLPVHFQCRCRPLPTFDGFEE